MGLFTVLVNGVPKYAGGSLLVGDGTLSNTSPGYASDPDTGFVHEGSGVVDYVSNGGRPVQLATGVGLSSDAVVSWSALGGNATGAKDTIIQKIGPNRLGVYDGSTTAGTIRLGIPEFSQTASTFAQTATITNGPRAANPVHWLEVTFNNGGSSGRIPIW